MAKYRFASGYERHNKFPILVSGVMRDVDYVAHVCFSTKKEAQSFSQSQRKNGLKCRVIKENVDGDPVYVPYLYGTVPSCGCRSR